MTPAAAIPPGPPSPPAPPRYVMIGGFLGAGKTTLIARLARHLTDQGWRVGLITNDQGQALVDTAMLRARGFATEEIPGGCFCCRFDSLLEATARLATQARPDLFIAEPVGSCTDLVATVGYPLRRLYGDRFTVAPLSVLVDPVRAMRVFGLAPGGRFSERVRYIYRKQLEEADLLVINKRDLLDMAQLTRLTATLAAAFPNAEIFALSARSGDGLEPWLARLMSREQTPRPTMEMDYPTYADAEARLGWLNAAVRVSAPAGVDGNALLRALAQCIQESLDARQAEIAHLKMTLIPDEGLGELAAINLVRNDLVPELAHELSGPVRRGQLIVNCRAETAPETLLGAVEQALAAIGREAPGLTLRLEHSESFRPAPPRPTHRVTDSSLVRRH